MRYGTIWSLTCSKEGGDPAINRHERRQAKINALRDAGYTGPVGRVRDLSWNTINQIVNDLRSGTPPTIPAPGATRTRPPTPGPAPATDARAERRQRKIDFLRASGYDGPVSRLRDRSWDEVKEIAATTITERARQEVQTQIGPNEFVWEFQPFPINYTQEFAWKVKYQVVDTKTGEIQTRWITVLSHKDRTLNEILNGFDEFIGIVGLALNSDTRSGLGAFDGITEIIPMRRSAK